MFGDMQIGKWLKLHDNLPIDDSIINIVDGKNSRWKWNGYHSTNNTNTKPRDCARVPNSPRYIHHKMHNDSMPGHSLSSYSYASAMSAAPHVSRLSLSSSTSSLFLIATPDIETKQWKIDGQSESIKQHSDSITLIYKISGSMYDIYLKSKKIKLISIFGEWRM
ncbi:hypothetical protein YC2023_094917 [Brassica napus]